MFPKVKDIGWMFEGLSFKGDISQWGVLDVTEMRGMFWLSKFNKDISSWNVSNVTTMSSMFARSKFNGDISSWNIEHREMSYYDLLKNDAFII